MNQRVRQGIELYFRRVLGPGHRWLLLASFVATALAVLVVGAKWNINSDFRELLPGNSEAAQAMEEVAQRVGSGSSLFVVIDSPEGEANRRFAAAYSEALLELPDVALAHFHNDKSFFEDHKLLYVPVEDLREIQQEIDDRLRSERQRRHPGFVSLDDGDEQPIDTSRIDERYEELAHQDYREYLEAEDGYSLTMVVRFSQASTDLSTTRSVLDEVRRVGEELDPTSYHPQMEFEFGGGLAHRDAQYGAIVDDLWRSALFTLVGIFVVLTLYFRRKRAVLLVLAPLVMAVVWTFAAAFLVFGELTTISVFVFAILLGLGMDFGIHLLNGYDRERQRGRSALEALERCYGSVGRATVMGAVTTFCTFLVLSFAQFRGLSQFGQVSAMGVVAMVLAVVVVLPALLLTLHDRWPHDPERGGEGKAVRSVQSRMSYEDLGRWAPGLLMVAGLCTAAALWQIPNLEFEENFRRIAEVEPPWQRVVQDDGCQDEEEAARRATKTARTMREKAREVRRTLDPGGFVPDREQKSTGDKYTSALRGQHSSTPTLVLTDRPEQAEKVHRHLSRAKERGELDTVRSIASIYALMPGDEAAQKERLEVLEEIRRTLEEEDLEELDDEERRRLEELRRLAGAEPIEIYDLPDWSKRMFREAGPEAHRPAEGEEFAFEYLVYVNEAIDHMKGDEARRFLSQVQRSVDDSGVEARIASQSFIYTAMLDEIGQDGRNMLGLSLLVVLLLLSLYFRSPLRASVALIPLCLGAIWTFGFCAWFGIKLDFFNVVVLPVIIGIGVDDGLHVYHRYLERGRGSILEVSENVGAAVGMTTLTSVIGFGGLAITDYAGLQSIGYLAIAGLMGAFLATLMVLPALLWMAERYEWTALLPDQTGQDEEPG